MVEELFRGVWPRPRSSIRSEGKTLEQSLGPIISEEMIDAAREHMEMIKGYLHMGENEAREHFGDMIYNGYIYFAQERDWKIVLDAPECLGLYIPPWKRVTINDLDKMTFLANRKLFVYRELREEWNG